MLIRLNNNLHINLTWKIIFAYYDSWRGRRWGNHRNLFFSFGQKRVLNFPLNLGVNGVVATHINIFTRFNNRPKLTHQNGAGLYQLTTINPNAAEFTANITTLTSFTTPGFLMSHKSKVQKFPT